MLAFPACSAPHAAAALMPAMKEAARGAADHASAKMTCACTAPAGGKAASGSRHPWQPSLKLHAATLICMLASQVLLVLTQGLSTGRPAAASAQPLRSVLLMAAPLLWVLWRPEAYWRCRAWAVPAWVVLLTWAVPSPSGAALVLGQAPSPGLLGAAADVLRVAGATRVLPWAFWSALVPAAPTAALAMHTGMALLTRQPQAHCAAPLLSAPGLVLQVSSVLRGEAASDALCHATLSWLLAAIGLLAPLLISVWTWQPPTKKAAEAAEGAAGDGSGSGWRQLGRRALLAAAACDGKLHYWLGGAIKQPAVRAVLTWMLLSVCWVACSMAAGL
ncbi:hypothetical protein ABPG75_006861 [Micractinium tetrahymenae]